jgi:hypothetical protein
MRAAILFIAVGLTFTLSGCGDDGDDSGGMNAAGGAGGEGGAGAVGGAGGEGGAGAVGGAGGMAETDSIAIQGVFGDGAGRHDITDEFWTQTYEGSEPSSYAFVNVDNESSFAIAQNGSQNAFNPDLFSRFDWHWTNSGLFYCQSAYDATTAEAAQETNRPDDTDPSVAGCGGMFPWSTLTPVTQILLVGDYTDAGMGAHVISQNVWAQTYGESTSHFIFTQVVNNEGNESGQLIAKNGPENEFNPGLWSRFDWKLQQGDYWYCQSAYDAPTATDAGAAAAADDSDVENSGCGGMFPWSRLNAQ